MYGGEERRAYGPRRSEERRAEEDLEVMREASSRHEDVLASRKAVDAEVRRLQQQAETEQRVVTGGPPLQAPIAMYRFGGFAQAPLSSCPYDEFLLSPLPCEPKALAGTPSLSAEGNF